MNNLNHDLIKDKVLAKIESGEAYMKPRWHFILKTVLWLSGTVIVALLLIFVASLTLFSLRQTGVLFIPAFGFRGIGAFLLSLPWILIVFAVVFIIVLEILVKRYTFAYRRPLLYSILGILFFVIIGSILISITHFHQGLYRSVREGRSQLAKPLYRDFSLKELRHVQRGEIILINDNGFRIVKPPDDDEFDVIISSQTRLPFGMDFEVGDTVVVFGEKDDSTIEAIGVRKVGEDMPPRFHAGPGKRQRFYLPR